MTIEKIKEQILENYREWVETALQDREDRLGIVKICVDDMTLKLNNLEEEIRRDTRSDYV